MQVQLTVISNLLLVQKMRKDPIILSIPLVWGIRNFILSGIVEELEKRYEVYFAVPDVGRDYMVKLGIAEDRLIFIRSQRYSSIQRFISKLIHKTHKRRYPTESDRVFKNLGGSRKVARVDRIISVLSYLFQWNLFFRALEYLDQILFVRRIDPVLINRIKEIKPAFAVSTSFVVNTEWTLFRLLHHLGVFTYTHILSFDNLTSRGYLPIRRFNKFLVWNEKMADELQAIYAIRSSQISITGTPQFDFHKHPRFLESREKTCSHLGVGGERFILYCANHYALTPDEPKLFEKIVVAFKRNVELASYRVVLRLHPMDDYDRWADVLNRCPEVCVSYPWPHRNKNDIYWGEPTLDDVIRFSNMLRYSDLVLNIASTVSIDAAILDKPVVCVGFSSDRSDPLNSLYYDFHFSTHYAPIMDTGGTPLATDLDELVSLAEKAVRNPKELSKERAEMVRRLCGVPDGNAAARIVKCVDAQNLSKQVEGVESTI